ncbi:MAG TPA: quinone-dependent dihydroorotate dehydrogenase [Cellvibrionaceae bacterium]
MYALIRDLLFRFDAETSHELTLDWLGAAQRLKLLPLFVKPMPQAPVEVFGLKFPNPIGLAAGLDKNADYVEALGSLGFGFVEVGTVTPLAQTGNPKPRLFRLPARQAVINRMGFNNKGVAHLVSRVAKGRNYSGILGINIGKNKNTPDDQALGDYEHCLTAVYPHADYITVNISSPNTPGLRALQYGDTLSALLDGLKLRQQRLTMEHGRHVPLVVKIAPDMSDEEIRDFAQRIVNSGMDGIIATNTTLSREGVEGVEHAEEAGGLSGAPVKNKSTHTISVLAQELQGKLPIIGVGGILKGEDAAEKLRAGASLVQIYSGFIYRGPGLIAEACAACHDNLK